MCTHCYENTRVHAWWEVNSKVSVQTGTPWIEFVHEHQQHSFCWVHPHLRRQDEVFRQIFHKYIQIHIFWNWTTAFEYITCMKPIRNPYFLWLPIYCLSLKTYLLDIAHMCTLSNALCIKIWAFAIWYIRAKVDEVSMEQGEEPVPYWHPF